MMGLTVLAAIAAYVGLTWFAMRKLKVWWAKAILIVFALAVPFWDFPVGFLNFYRHCAEDAGLQIRKTIPASNAILIDASAGYTPEEVIRMGFKVVEYESTGKVLRYTSSNAGLSKSVHLEPVSTLRLQFTRHQRLPWNLIRNSYIATRLDNREIVATHTTYHWLGLWWQVRAAPLFGSGTKCFGDSNESLLAVIIRGAKG